MENQRNGRAQPYFNNAMNISQQQQQASVSTNKPFNSTTSSNNGNFHSSHKAFGNSQSDPTRSKARGKSVAGERFRGNGNNRFVQHDRGGPGHQRRPASYQQDNEVRNYGQRDGNNRIAEKVSRQGENASHLLNFTYAPLRSQEEQGGGRPARRVGKAKRQVIHTKEQFLQAHCQFVVKNPVCDSAYAQCLTDADKIVSWDDIEQVILRDEQVSTCPICMEVPVASKITKCAHIYCWPCILHYLSLADRAWARCPICFDSVEEKDLKSVMTTAASKPKVGDEITLYLMKRERESLYVRPTRLWKASDAGHMFNPLDGDEDVKYSKLLSSTSHYLDMIVSEERKQLQALLHQEETLSLEASFVQAALDSIGKRIKKTDIGLFPSLTELKLPAGSKAEVGSEAEAATASVPAIKSARNLQSLSYSDAFEEISCPGDKDSSSDSQLSIVVTSSPVDTAKDGSSYSVDSSNDVKSLNPDADSQERVRTISSASSSDGVEAELIAADLVLPPTGTQPGHASGSKRTEVYYFYQAADGQHVYLHSINTRILAAQYGSLEMAPAVLTATIVETEDNSMTLDLRKRLKYLSHLPLYSQFAVCEVVLRPPVVSSLCLSHFLDEVNQRKRMRNRRQRTETRQYNKAQAEERRRMGRYPDMALSLDSDRHFPSSSADDSMPPSLAEFAPLVDALPLSDQVACEHIVPSRQHEVPLTTPYSFAQAMKGSAESPAVWPRVQTNYARSSGLQPAEKVTDGAEAGESSAPSFQESFIAGFTQLDISRSTTEEPTNSRAEKKGRNKKKKTQVLFTTSSHRGNL